MNFLGYELKYNLGVTRDIKRAFNRDFNKVVTNELSIDDIIKFIYTCLVDKDMKLNEFTDYVYESDVGLGDIQETYMNLTIKLMYPGLTVDEGKMKLRELQDQN
jgi:hypothetical protein